MSKKASSLVKVIVPLTVTEILDEQVVRVMA